MDITEFEKEFGLEPGEITQELRKKFPKFSKSALSLARHSDRTGITLSPKATTYLAKRYGYTDEITNNFSEILHESGLTWAELSKQAKISQLTIYQITKDIGNPTIKTLARICSVLGCDIGDIYSIK